MMNGNPNLSRRRLLQLGLTGAAGALFADAFMPLAHAAPSWLSPTAGGVPKAKSVIQIWLWGGPCHLDTFDPKPEAGNEYVGQFTSPIATNVDGIRICELLPLLAKQADKYALIRSMTHGTNGHETAAYLVQTGRNSGDGLVYPSVGAVVSHFKGYQAGYKGLIPPYIVLTQPQGRFSEAGFMGSRYKPFATGGDPNSERFAVEGVVSPSISDERQASRRKLLHQLDTLGAELKGDAELTASAAAEQQAYDLILGDAGKVFDLSQEKPELRDQYGRNRFGQSCLAARRLVERGVPYITINYNGWDTHKQHFQAMRRMLPELDRGLATLLQDLSDRGLLGSTIVWCGGEFGRTPKVQWEAPWQGGRGHYGKVFSCLLAGGGFKGGRVVGASSAKGEEVKDRPVTPQDVIGGIYELMGIDGSAKLPHPQGKDVLAMPRNEKGIGGRLKEII